MEHQNFKYCLVNQEKIRRENLQNSLFSIKSKVNFKSGPSRKRRTLEHKLFYSKTCNWRRNLPSCNARAIHVVFILEFSSSVNPIFGRSSHFIPLENTRKPENQRFSGVFRSQKTAVFVKNESSKIMTLFEVLVRSRGHFYHF